jgi:hypothetical protein
MKLCEGAPVFRVEGANGKVRCLFPRGLKERKIPVFCLDSVFFAFGLWKSACGVFDLGST